MGKQSVIVIVALFILGFLGLCAIWIKVIALAIAVMVLILVGGGLFAIQKTLENYPQQSMMEGTDIIKYRQQEIEIGSKEVRTPPPEQRRSISEPGEPPQLPPGENPEEPDQ